MNSGSAMSSREFRVSEEANRYRVLNREIAEIDPLVPKVKSRIPAMRRIDLDTCQAFISHSKKAIRSHGYA